MPYALAPRGKVEFELRGKLGSPRGSLQIVRGNLELNPLDLAKTRGHVEFDLASIVMEADADAEAPIDYTAQAKRWLSLGDARPESERQRLRWARFDIERVHDLSAETADAGRKVDIERSPSNADDAGIDTEGIAGPPIKATRTVDLTLEGSLTLHQARVVERIRTRVAFQYAEEPRPGATPIRLAITALRPITISLEAHDIVPRDAKGTTLARDLKLLGREVGRTARVEFELVATPGNSR